MIILQKFQKNSFDKCLSGKKATFPVRKPKWAVREIPKNSKFQEFIRWQARIGSPDLPKGET